MGPQNWAIMNHDDFHRGYFMGNLDEYAGKTLLKNICDDMKWILIWALPQFFHAILKC